MKVLLVLILILAAFPLLAADAVAPTLDLQPLVTELKQTGNDLLVQILLAVITAAGAAGTALIGYLFTYLRSRWKILELTQLDERIEAKLLGAWSDTRQGLYTGFKRQAGPGNKITWEQSQACMSASMQTLYSKLTPAEFARLGIESKDEFIAWAKTQFENITDAAKGKLNIDLGKSARLAVGKIRTPVLGGELKGFEISTKF